MKNKAIKHTLEIRHHRSNRLHLRMEFTGEGSKAKAMETAKAVDRANPGRYTAEIGWEFAD